MAVNTTHMLFLRHIIRITQSTITKIIIITTINRIRITIINILLTRQATSIHTDITTHNHNDGILLTWKGVITIQNTLIIVQHRIFHPPQVVRQ